MATPTPTFHDYWNAVKAKLGPPQTETGSIIQEAYRAASEKAWNAALELVGARWQHENDILRGLLPKVGVRCPYCGINEMARCQLGFPGCSWADDLICGEDATMMRLLHENRAFNCPTDPCLTWDELFKAAQEHSLDAVKFVDRTRRFAPLIASHRL